MYDRQLLKKYQTQFEARRKFPYDDKTGQRPIVYLPNGEPGGKITIGVGWNLTDNGIPEEIIDRLHDIALDNTEKEVRQAFPWFLLLSGVRQLVIMDMAFNMGIPTLRTFAHTLDMVRVGNYQEASRGMMNSLWAKQVKNRAKILSVMMATGELPKEI